MNPSPHYRAGPYVRPGQLGGLKKVLRKVLPIAAAGASVASGNPRLAIAAYATAKTATAKSPKVAPPVAPIEPQPFLGSLPPGDRNAIMIGGAVLGGLVLSRLLTRKG